MDARSRSHLGLMDMAVAWPASRPVVNHVAR